MSEQFRYEGFTSPNGTIVPDDVFDILLPHLSDPELRVLLYIIRRTFGFKKESDTISLKQMVEGIRTRDGRILDQGAGVSKASAARGVKGLIEKGIVTAQRNRSAEKGDEPTTYTLRFRDPVSPTETRGYLNLRQGGVSVGDTQQTVEQQTVKQEEYPSKIRKAEKEEMDYVNQRSEDNRNVGATPTTEETEQRKGARPSKTTNAGNEEKQRLTKNRKVEEPQRKEVNPPDREISHKLQTGETATPGLMSLGDVLHQQHMPQAVPDDEAYEAIRDYIRDMAGKHHDEASLNSSTTRAYNLYQRSGVSLSYFFNVFYDADKEAGRRSGSIKKRTADGFTNRMPYIFAYLEDKLGLREKPH